MKTAIRLTTAAVLFSVLLAAGTGDAYAQRGSGGRKPDSTNRMTQHEGRRGRVDRFERLKQMRLIEELQLNEEESVRFMAKRREHEDRMKTLADERNRVLDDLGIMLEDGADRTELDGQINRVFESDRKMLEERGAYQSEMKKMLPVGKFARLLIFERDFQHQVRDAMGRSLNRRGSKFDD